MISPSAGDLHRPAPAAPSTGAFRSARPELRAARVGIGVAIVAAAAEGVVSLVAAAVTGWAMSIDPGGGTAPVDRMHVSAGVAGLMRDVMAIATGAWLLVGLSLVVGAVGVVRWQCAALANMAALGARPRRSPAAAAAAWFVPVWALLAPKQTFDDLWRSSEPGLPPSPERTALDAVALPPAHAVWRGLWVGAQVVNLAGAIRPTRDGTLATMHAEQLTMVGVDLALVAAGLLLHHILAITTARQEARWAEMGTAVRIR